MIWNGHIHLFKEGMYIITYIDTLFSLNPILEDNIGQDVRKKYF